MALVKDKRSIKGLVGSNRYLVLPKGLGEDGAALDVVGGPAGELGRLGLEGGEDGLDVPQVGHLVVA